ncbi:MAG: hypothetical protein AB4062_20085 [Crocosphaera sp.]
MDILEKPVGTFAEAMKKEPSTSFFENKALSPGDKFELFNNGKSIGWIGSDSRRWAVVEKEEEALTLVPLVSHIKDWVHYEIKEFRGTLDRWMSSQTSGNCNVGYYSWISGAHLWQLNKENQLVNHSNFGKLSIHNSKDGYLYTNNRPDFIILTVKKRRG